MKNETTTAIKFDGSTPAKAKASLRAYCRTEAKMTTTADYATCRSLERGHAARLADFEARLRKAYRSAPSEADALWLAWYRVGEWVRHPASIVTLAKHAIAGRLKELARIAEAERAAGKQTQKAMRPAKSSIGGLWIAPNQPPKIVVTVKRTELAPPKSRVKTRPAVKPVTTHRLFETDWRRLQYVTPRGVG